MNTQNTRGSIPTNRGTTRTGMMTPTATPKVNETSPWDSSSRVGTDTSMMVAAGAEAVGAAADIGIGIAGLAGNRRDREEARKLADQVRGDELRSEKEWDTLNTRKVGIQREGQDIDHLARKNVLKFDSFLRELKNRQKKYDQTNESIQRIGEMANQSQGMKDIMLSLLGSKKQEGSQ